LTKLGERDWIDKGDAVWLNARPLQKFWAVGYPSGQRGQTVNLLAHAFDGSNPSPTTTPKSRITIGKTPLFCFSDALVAQPRKTNVSVYLRVTRFSPTARENWIMRYPERFAYQSILLHCVIADDRGDVMAGRSQR
jgi:hypothetical protein